MRVALVSRELYPFGGGGIGEYVDACARLLSGCAEVTIFTTDAHENSYRARVAAADSRILTSDVQIVFVPEAVETDVGGYFSSLHLYSARVLDSLKEHYGAVGPDLVEFPDYLGEGAVTVQARRTGDAFLRRSLTAIRVHTSAEICAVLDGYVDNSFPARITCELERLALRDADYVLWAGGDILSAYRRFYGRQGIAPSKRIRHPARTHEETLSRRDNTVATGLINLLYLGRLERRKGIHNLVRAMSYVDSDHLRLDIVGADTDTAPLGMSMRTQLQVTTAGDARITLHASVARTEVADVIRRHDVIVMPSLWEAWPYVGLEALRLDRALVATPVGGFAEMVQQGASGWLTADTTTQALAVTLERLTARRQELERLRGEGAPSKVFAALTDGEEIIQSYRSLVANGGRWTTSGAARESGSKRRPVADRPPTDGKPIPSSVSPLVSVIIPYYRLDAHIDEAVCSALDQTHPWIEVIIVNDGSLRDVDWVLGDLATRYPVAVLTQINAGLGAARNFGITQARGQFIVPLDADNLLEPTFVERALLACQIQPEPVYVTSWSRYIDENGDPLPAPNVGYQPLGNSPREVLCNNVAGDATALFRRHLFDSELAYSEELTSYEDWQLYQELHVAGRYGVVVPERLFRYRMRPDSMIRHIGVPHQGRLSGELAAHLRESEVRWTSSRD